MRHCLKCKNTDTCKFFKKYYDATKYLWDKGSEELIKRFDYRKTFTDKENFENLMRKITNHVAKRCGEYEAIYHESTLGSYL